jgi:POT family proton-dependent oligopeptide transporter
MRLKPIPMAEVFAGSEDNQKTVLTHPAGLFILFFTEMWERFSYYGMRALLILYITSEITKGGMGWTSPEALQLYGWYTGLVYLTPIIGGIIADKFTGARNAIIIGALLMTLGHASLAFETTPMFYAGLALLILGNGLFKPNISGIVGALYKDGSKKKDAGYTIFYMGINAGAFLGIALCGWLGEKVGFSYGFGLAGIFMFFGMLQFYFGQKIFGKLGLKRTDSDKAEEAAVVAAPSEDQIKADPALHANPKRVERDRLIVVAVLAFFTIFFWLAFEQAGGSMTLFSEDFTDRNLAAGAGAEWFLWIDVILMFIPLGILTYVLYSLASKIVKKYPLTILFTGISFAIIWGLMIYKTKIDFADENLEIPASWFGILNSFFIITFAPLFSRMWEKMVGKSYNPSGPQKFAIGLILVAVGFGFLAYGASGIALGAESAKVSVIWLVLAYFFHTMGELSLSPVGLSYVSKLSPKRLIGMMFGIWFVANFIANTVGGLLGSSMESVSESHGLSGFFFLFVGITLAAAIALLIMNRYLKKKMHGIE